MLQIITPPKEGMRLRIRTLVGLSFCALGPSANDFDIPEGVDRWRVMPVRVWKRPPVTDLLSH